ncbi:MAG: 4Fe-4S dicluster domain-containing protein [Burkholderiaceae bacterium]|nr:4Fe-4S dicluster domain-containing protein [Burkholderiaceae bacterium]
MTRYAMALDTVTCIGCNACTLACKVENASPSGIWMAPVVEREFGEYPAVRKAFLPLLCNHCEDAPCVKACPTGAIKRRDDGIVLIDPDVCCGSGACVIACPYGAISYYGHQDPLKTPYEKARVSRHQTGVAQKCTFCAPRLDRGLEPACVEACPTGARIFGDLEDPQSPVSRVLADRESVPLGSPVPTGASVRYLTDGVKRAGGSVQDIALKFRPQKAWRFVQVLQFWLLGAGAGVYALSRYLAPDALLFGLDLGAALALILVAGTNLMLTSHLGKPARFLNALRNWRTSWIARGAIADFVFLGAVGVQLLPMSQPWRTSSTILALVSGLIVIAYPGLSMRAFDSVPAWRGWRLPAEALAEAAMSGAALVGLFVGWNEEVLLALLAAALIRMGLTGLWWANPLTRLGGIWSCIASALAAGALLQPSSAVIVGPIAGLAALFAALVSKQANMEGGRSPSPFGPKGELDVWATQRARG